MSDVLDRLTAALADRYRIERELGQGGMATVYLAQDLKHNRQVAIKVLRPELAAVVGQERFFAEIETTAQLQHPNILPLFDSGEVDGTLFYCMPYVEGETLGEWLSRERQLPVDTALDITRKLASALDYAHQRGVVHRDIKPANVLISSGEPLIADFGIALAVSRAGDGRITETGLSLGTPHYMSPEQASGDRSLDPRSDVYALGCVLYEMLIGEPPFPGPSAQAVLARILTAAPTRVTLGRPTVPPHVDAAVARALEKLPADRFATAGDLRKALDDPSFRHVVADPSGSHPVIAQAAPSPAPPPPRLVRTLAAVALLAIAAAAWGWLRPDPEAPIQRLRLDVETFAANGPEIAVSPDGTRIVYVGVDRQLYLRPLSSLEAQVIPGTQDARGPFFSPDGLSIGFNMGSPSDRIHTLALSGGTPVPVGSADDPVDVQAAWSEDGFVYFIRDAGPEMGVLRAPAQGGAAEPVATDQVYFLPVVVRGVTDKLLVRREEAGFGFLDVAGGAFRPVEGLARATDVWVAGGYAFWRAEDGTLAAARFDAEGERLTSPPVTLARSVNAQGFTVSENGVLVYAAGGASGQSEAFAWISPDGTREAVDPDLTAALTQYEGVRISPDGRYLAMAVERGVVGGQELRIFVYDLREATWQQLTFEGTHNVSPRWLPDGRVAFLSNQGGRASYQIWAKPFDRSAEETLLFSSEAGVLDFETSPVAGAPMAVVLGGTQGADIHLVDPEPGAEPRPLVTTRFDERSPTISPDGRWVAYGSDESGIPQIYVRSFPDGGRPWPITLETSIGPAWGPTSEEMYYLTRDGFYRADLDLSDGVRVVSRVEVPMRGDEEMFGAGERTYDIADDGRVVTIVAPDIQGGPGEDGPGARLPVVVVNVFREIEERLARTGGR